MIIHAKFENSIFYGSKVISNVRVDNKQTDRHDKNNVRIIRSEMGDQTDHSIGGIQLHVSLISIH